MYLTKASMIVNACQHTMPVGTIQKPCFIDNFCFQVQWLSLYFFRKWFEFHIPPVSGSHRDFLNKLCWFKTVKTLKRSYCISNLNSMLILFVAWLSWPLLAFILTRLVLFHRVCVYVCVCVGVCTRVVRLCMCLHTRLHTCTGLYVCIVW